MKAVRFMGPNQIEISQVPKPTIREDEILIRVKVVGVCGTDMDLLTGDMPHIKNGFTKYPLIPGHEWSGVIEAVGSVVPGFLPGDRVTGDVSIGCGCCKFCKTGHYNLCQNRVVVGSYRNKDGAYAEYVTLPYRHVYKIPDNLSLDEAALAEPAATAAYAVMRAKVGIGDSVLVIGDGAIGQLAMQFSKVAGANKVFIVGSWDEKLEIARQTGADATANYKRDDIVKFCRDLTEGLGADVVIETSGNTKAFNFAIQALKPGGKLAILSFYSDVEIAAQINAIIVKDAELIGVLASPNAFVPTLAMMESGRINVKPLITHKYPLEQVEQVFEMIKDKKECRIKILLEP